MCRPFMGADQEHAVQPTRFSPFEFMKNVFCRGDDTAAFIGSIIPLWYLEGMEAPEKQSPTTLIYRSGTSQALGPDWDVLEVSRNRKEHGVISTNSVFIARNVGGTIIRKIDSSPERWVLVRDEETLRACQGRFDHRDKLAGEEAAGAGRKVEEE